MKDERGVVVYVGKAQSLRSRVRSYWQKATPAGEIHRIRSVIDRVAEVEYTLTDSVSEALLLEANLIKRFKPRFNVRLKDDKSYPYIKITLADDFPRIERTRKLPNDGSRYFGPYASAVSVDESMNLVRRLFPFRTCTIDIKDGERALQRPCLLYHIKRCQGPCIEAISKDAYRADIAQVELFLEGRQETLVKALEGEMAAAADREEYERAAIVRDKIRAIERTMESQKMAGLRPHGAGPDRARPRRQPGRRPAVRDPRRQDGRARRVPARRGTRGEPTTRCSRASSSSSTPGPPRSRARSTCRPGRPTSRSPRTWRRSSPSAAAGRSTSACRSGARSAQLMDLAARNAAETLAREQARWLADQGKTLAALEELADALGLRGAPAADRVLRHQQLPGQRIGRQHGRLRGGQAALRRVPALPDPDGRGPERLRQPPGGPAPPLPARERGSRGERGGAPLGDAGPRPHRRRPRPGQRREGRPRRAGAPRHRRWPGWPRSARSCSCPTAPTPSSCRRPHRRSTSSSACATRRTASRSPTTATCGRRRRSARRSTTCPASGRSASANCSRCSARSSASATPRWSRSRPCRASDAALAQRIKATLEA